MTFRKRWLLGCLTLIRIESVLQIQDLQVWITKLALRLHRDQSKKQMKEWDSLKCLDRQKERHQLVSAKNNAL